MSSVLSNKYLIANALGRQLTYDLVDRLDFDYESVYEDVWMSAKNYRDTLPIDKRSIATGTLGDIYLEDMYTTKSFGWSDACYMFTEHYPQMLYDIKKPQTMLVHSPDVSLGLMSAASSDGCELSFFNNKYLHNFEKFVLKHPEYVFESSYNVYDLQEFSSIDGNAFDMILATAVDFIIDIDLLNHMIDILNPGGALVVYCTNAHYTLYNHDYHLNPVLKIFNIVDSNPNINTYHMTNNQGYNVIIKN